MVSFIRHKDNIYSCKDNNCQLLPVTKAQGKPAKMFCRHTFSCNKTTALRKLSQFINFRCCAILVLIQFLRITFVTAYCFEFACFRFRSESNICFTCMLFLRIWRHVLYLVSLLWLWKYVFIILHIIFTSAIFLITIWFQIIKIYWIYMYEYYYERNFLYIKFA